MTKDLTVIILAYNEEPNIEAAIESVIMAVKDVVDNYEIIVMNDGSLDRTGELAQAKANKNPKIQVVHNEKNLGYGAAYRKGLALATKTYVTTFSGDNDMSAGSLKDLIAAMGSSDVVCSYYKDQQCRPWARRFISATLVMFINLLFGLRLKYYNGSSITRLKAVRAMNLRSVGMAVNSECLVKLLKSGASYREVGFNFIGRKGGKSTAVSLKSLCQVMMTLCILIDDIYLRRKYSSGKIQTA